MKKQVIFLLLFFPNLVFAKIVILDVRTPDEFMQGHISDAQNVDVQNPDFGSIIKKMDRSDEYLVYCAKGKRAALATKIMQDLQFDSVKNLGGIDDAKKYLGL